MSYTRLTSLPDSLSAGYRLVAAANMSSRSFLPALAFFAFTRFHIDGIARCQIEKQPRNTKKQAYPFLSFFSLY